MTITTKYDVMQMVWVELRGTIGSPVPPEPDRRQIHGIFIDHAGVIVYHLEKYRGPFVFQYLESDVYPTEEALLAAYPYLEKSK